MKSVTYNTNIVWFGNESSVGGLHQACVLECNKFEELG